MSLRVILVVAIVCLVLLVIGIVVDSAGFVGNLIAGAIEVTITVTIIEWLLQRHRRERWQKVRLQIVSALTQYMDNMMDEYQTRIYGPRLNLLGLGMKSGPYGSPNPQTAEALQAMLKQMKEAPPPKNSTETAKELYTAMKWDIEQILGVLMPRVLAIECDEPNLVGLLGEFDNTIRGWCNEIIVDEEISLGCDQYSTAIETLKSMTNIYEYLLANNPAAR